MKLQNNRFYTLPWLVWFSLVFIGTFSTFFLSLFASFMYGSEVWLLVVITMLLLFCSGLLLYFLVLVFSYYQVYKKLTFTCLFKNNHFAAGTSGPVRESARSRTEAIRQGSSVILWYLHLLLRFACRQLRRTF